jgi:hypothetical protein
VAVVATRLHAAQKNVSPYSDETAFKRKGETRSLALGLTGSLAQTNRIGSGNCTS